MQCNIGLDDGDDDDDINKKTISFFVYPNNLPANGVFANVKRAHK